MDNLADEVVLLAKTEGELKDMMKRLKRYLKKKRIVLSEEKSKVMIFEKVRGRTKERRWSRGDKTIEEVKKMNYLGYTLQKNESSEKHLQEIQKSDDSNEK